MSEIKYTDAEKQRKANNLVEREIHHNLCMTMQQELRNNPEILDEAKHFYPIDEEGKRDDENGQYPEIYEYWAISGWLAERLEEKNEIVFDCLDFIVWGRECTGQAICLDNVIQNIAIENLF